MTQKNKPASIIDVSKKAGVSIATASRALNDSELVRPATKNHILEIAKQLGYTLPERRSGKSVKKKKVAFINFMDRFHMNTEPSALLQRGILQTAQEHHITILSHFVSTELNLAEEADLNGIAGFLLHGYEPRDDVQAWLKKRPCCWVTNNPWTPTWGDHVMPDHREAGIMASEYLIQHNCRHLAIIKLGLIDRVAALREEGFSYHAAKNGIKVSSVSARNPKLTESQGYPEIAYIDEIIKKSKETITSCDGLFFDSDHALAVLYPIMVSEKIITPGKTTLVGCNNNQAYLQKIKPHPATMDVHFEQIGRVGLNQLLWRIKNPDDKRIRSLISPSLISLT